MSEEITKVCLAVEINDKPYFVALPRKELMLLVKLATSMTDDGRLPVKKAPEGFKFIQLDETT